MYADFIKEISAETNYSQKTVREVLTAFIEKVKEGVRRGEDVRIPRLGTFTVAERKERKGRNPQTGEEMIIPAKKVVKFRPSKELREVAA